MSEKDNSQPLVSIVMPTYNHDKFIIEAIESVINQTYRNIELIIIDNYSMDNTENIVKSYVSKDSRIIYKKHRNDGIIAISRNIGIKEASGNYIAFIDSDDFWLNNKIERVIEFFNKYPYVDLVCHDEFHIYENDKNSIKKSKNGPYKKYFDLLFKGNALSTSAVVLKKSKVFEAELFSEDKNFVTAEDYDLWLKLSRICSFEYLNETLGTWRVHEKSLSKNIEKHAASILNVINSHFDKWSDLSYYYKYLMNKRRGAVMRMAARILLREGDFISAKNYIINALKTNPCSIKSWIIYGACISKIRKI